MTEAIMFFIENPYFDKTRSMTMILIEEAPIAEENMNSVKPILNVDRVSILIRNILT